jgi:hypothetical protein
VSGNGAGGNGGGIAAGQSTVTLTNSTLSGNTSTGVGGGIGVGSGTASVKNTIIAGNTGAASAPDLAHTGSFTSQGYNLIGKVDGSQGFTNNVNNDQVGTSATPLDPKLGPLQNNGGPTFTQALLTGSPAIDKGAAATDPATGSPITTDQRGLTRPLDDPSIPNASGGNGSDIGSFEEQTLIPPPTTSTSTTLPTTTSTSTSTSTTSSSTSTSTSSSSTSSSTSTSTSTVPTTHAPTTTTLPAGDCAGVPDEPAFRSLNCRLAALIVAVQAETRLGDIRTKLVKALQVAKARKETAEAECADGDTKRARKRLQQTGQKLAQFSHRLRSNSTRKKVPTEAAREPFALDGDAIRKDAKTLQGELACSAS